jgi:hypothetical protein
MTIRTFRTLMTVATLFAAPTLAPAQDAISAPLRRRSDRPRATWFPRWRSSIPMGQVLRATP